MIPDKIIAASGNEGKIREIKEILKNTEIIPMKEAGFDEDIEETGSSFRENALIKARAVSEKTGLAVLADDSGLCVDFLGGAPGIYSARFSGEGVKANRALLLKRMQGATDRKAYFECAICLYYPDGRYVFGIGKTYGKILEKETGEGGFGYDPLFFSDDLNKSFAEAAPEEKNAVSHRARAIRDLLTKI
ncbi:MAG: RdgB/HAM1 family non-canonical purine NTP pyrophosphatase [Clostridia bacterium]|nr:RdgB/HAM1 family non-canonical purine NTP pyrophosphatase [Clostridia bacterium]